MEFVKKINDTFGKKGALIINTILLLAGFGILAIGIVCHIKLSGLETYLNVQHSHTGFYIAGVFVIVGCCLEYYSLFVESRLKLCIYFTSLTIIVLVVVIALVVSLVTGLENLYDYSDDHRHFLAAQLEAITSPNYDKMIGMQKTELNFKCCGLILGVTEYSEGDGLLNIPASCCGKKRETYEEYFDQSCTIMEAYTKVCSEEVKHMIKTTIAPIIIILIVIVLIIENWQLVALWYARLN